MKFYRYIAVAGVLLITAGLVLGMVLTTMAQDEEPNPLGEPPTFLRGIYDAWVGSGHAAFEDEAFVHWNEDGEVSDRCAKCHSTPGYMDFLGADGTAPGVDGPAPLGTVVNCDACHNRVSAFLTEVEFPSGAVIEHLGDSTRCMVCHQGRASGLSVVSAIESAGITDMNAVSEDLRFINIHYYAAAASRYGAEVTAGYEFEGQVYQPRFLHTEGYTDCADCHSPHTLELKVEECADCHDNVNSLEAVRGIRFNGSLIDYDGDGNINEGINDEIHTLQDMLMTAIQAYAREVIGTPIVYNPGAYPYFFVDANDDSMPDDGDTERYASFSANLLKAVYNYQVTKKDPGAFAHNAKYHIELLYDTIAMLNNEIMTPVDLSKAHRNDPGHFDATGEPFRHWDEDGEVSSRCVKCHTSDGLPFYLEHGTTINMEPSNSLSCNTCHDDIGEWSVHLVSEVTFPSGATVSFGEEAESNLCISCHQGRSAGSDVDNAVAGMDVDAVADGLRFMNIHYFAAGATLFGSEVNGAYQFEGKDYSGQLVHTRRFDECANCHNEHSLEIRYEECTECHEMVESAEDVKLIRMDEDYDPVDYDGDGDVTEPINDEIQTLKDALLVEIYEYAVNVAGAPIVYAPHNYPYWYGDTNGNGEFDEEENNRDNRFGTWTPTLLKAAYNYQYVSKDPGKFAHNPDYVLQFLYDTIEAVGGEEAVATFNRAPVREE